MKVILSNTGVLDLLRAEDYYRITFVLPFSSSCAGDLEPMFLSSTKYQIGYWLEIHLIDPETNIQCECCSVVRE